MSEWVGVSVCLITMSGDLLRDSSSEFVWDKFQTVSVVEYKRRSVLYRADRVESFGPVIIINIGSVVN